MLKRIILPYGYGQTCNQLFQIAHWIPASIERGIPLYFPGFCRYAKMFAGTLNQRFPRFPGAAPEVQFPEGCLAWLCASAARVPLIREGPIFKLAQLLPGAVTFAWDDSGCHGSADIPQVLDDPQVAAGESLWVRGWLYRDQSGVVRHKQAIKAFFSPTREVLQRVDACIKKNRDGKSALVGVHLRRGDYRKFSGGKFYYDDATMRWMMQQVTESLASRNVRFLLVSNEAVDEKKFCGLDIVTGPGDPAGDLLTLAACDYIMGPPSTFTMWASFYGDVPLYMINDPSVPPRIDRFAVCS